MPGSSNVMDSLKNLNRYQAGEISPTSLIFSLIIAALILAGLWRIYEKAGEKGWKALIPIYNLYILIKITNKPVGWFWFIIFGTLGGCLLFPLFGAISPLLLFIPIIILGGIGIVSFVMQIMIYHALSKSFGKGVGTTLGIIFLSFIFLPILGFGQAKYKKLK